MESPCDSVLCCARLCVVLFDCVSLLHASTVRVHTLALYFTWIVFDCREKMWPANLNQIYLRIRSGHQQRVAKILDEALLLVVVVVQWQTCSCGNSQGRQFRWFECRSIGLHLWLWQHNQFRSTERCTPPGTKQSTALSLWFVCRTTLGYSIHGTTRPQQAIVVVPNSSIRTGKPWAELVLTFGLTHTRLPQGRFGVPHLDISFVVVWVLLFLFGRLGNCLCADLFLNSCLFFLCPSQNNWTHCHFHIQKTKCVAFSKSTLLTGVRTTFSIGLHQRRNFGHNTQPIALDAVGHARKNDQFCARHFLDGWDGWTHEWWRIGHSFVRCKYIHGRL